MVMLAVVNDVLLHKYSKFITVEHGNVQMNGDDHIKVLTPATDYMFHKTRLAEERFHFNY